MQKLEKFLLENWQSSMTDLICCLENRSKSSLTFQRAVETVEKMGDLIAERDMDNKTLSIIISSAITSYIAGRGDYPDGITLQELIKRVLDNLDN